MTRQRKSFLVFLLALSCVVIGSSAGPVASQRLSPAEAKQMVKDGKGCTMPGDVFYTRGALALNNGRKYHCVEIFGENLQPAGSAWTVAPQ